MSCFLFPSKQLLIDIICVFFGYTHDTPPRAQSYIFVTMVTCPYISVKYKDDENQLSGHDPSGLTSASMSSKMALSHNFPVRNPQYPPSTQYLPPPPIPYTFLIKIWIWKFQGIFLRVKKINHDINIVLHLPPFITPHSWNTFNKDVNNP